MAEIIGLIVFLLCIAVWIVILMNGIRNKKRIKRNDHQSLKKQEEVESRIRKIEDVYGEKATLIMFQELNVPNICELLVILEEAQIILILGEAYNFSEILNLKIGQLDYIRLKHTAKSPPYQHTGTSSYRTFFCKYNQRSYKPARRHTGSYYLLFFRRSYQNKYHDFQVGRTCYQHISILLYL